jgi:hypothetical protein
MQVSKKVPTSKHFHNYLNLILILENIVEPVDWRMLAYFENLNFSLEQFYIL